jgi:hypothetical protein
MSGLAAAALAAGWAALFTLANLDSGFAFVRRTRAHPRAAIDVQRRAHRHLCGGRRDPLLMVLLGFYILGIGGVVLKLESWGRHAWRRVEPVARRICPVHSAPPALAVAALSGRGGDRRHGSRGDRARAGTARGGHGGIDVPGVRCGALERRRGLFRRPATLQTSSTGRHPKTRFLGFLTH